MYKFFFLSHFMFFIYCTFYGLSTGCTKEKLRLIFFFFDLDNMWQKYARDEGEKPRSKRICVLCTISQSRSGQLSRSQNRVTVRTFLLVSTNHNLSSPHPQYKNGTLDHSITWLFMHEQVVVCCKLMWIFTLLIFNPGNFWKWLARLTFNPWNYNLNLLQPIDIYLGYIIAGQVPLCN